MDVLQIRNIEKRFGSQTALAGFSLDVRDGEFLSLLGPSGCGKTTLLNILAGFERPDKGELSWRGKRFEQTPARARPFHMVFQGYALFPHLNVFDNVAFALRLQKTKENEILTRVRESLELVGLGAFERRSVETLSGGQQQRVAIARAIAPRPELLLLDEPMSALDRQLRTRMQTELRLLQKRLGLTFILVTHDQEEALSVSDRVALLHAGQLEQVGSPQEIYLEPRSAIVANFVGSRNSFDAYVTDQNGYKLCIRLNSGIEIWCVSQTNSMPSGAAVTAFVCPEHIRLRAPDSSAANTLQGRVIETIFRGDGKEALVETSSGISLRVRLEQEQSAASGDNVSVELPSLYTHAFLKDLT